MEEKVKFTKKYNTITVEMKTLREETKDLHNCSKTQTDDTESRVNIRSCYIREIIRGFCLFICSI